MGIFDEAKAKVEGLVGSDKVDSALDRVEGLINEKTDDKFADKVDQATDQIKERLGGHAD